MRRATTLDTEAIKQVYQDSFRHAHTVGTIDWPDPSNTPLVDELISTQELYAFEQEGTIVGAARLSEHADPRIWADQTTSALYLAKLATSEKVRGTNYLQTHMLPEIEAHANESKSLRLDCLAENARLKTLYLRLGFTALGNASFFSDKQHKEITVTKFERQIT